MWYKMGLRLPQGIQTRMNLSKRLTGDFSATVRNRGRNYYWQGRVSIRHASNSQVDALVRGSRSYEVSLDWEDGMLAASCDCAHFESEPCKHLSAAILAAEERGYLSGVSAADVILVCGGGEADDGSTARLSQSQRLPVQAPT